MEIYTGARVQCIEKDGVVFERNGQNQKAECDAVLMAVGRQPYTEGLGLEYAGVKTEKGKSEVFLYSPF